MNMDNQRAPLSVKNSGIPKPSRLPQPGTRKRALTETEPVSHGKENGPAVKRVKLATKTVTAAPKTTTKPAAKVAPKTSTVRAAKAPLKASTKSNTVAGSKPKPPSTTNARTSATTAKASTAAKSTKSSRPAWDIKGKLQDMATEQKQSASTILDLRSQLESVVSRLGDLETLKETQESTIQVKEKERSVANQQIMELEDQIAIKQSELDTLRREKVAAETRAADLDTSLATCKSEVASLQSALSQTMTSMAALQAELEATKITRDTAINDGVTKAATISSLEEQVRALNTTIQECQAKIREDESVRRKLHNAIQELKGNIRVFCRVRPLLPTDPGYLLDDTGRESSVSGGSRGSSNGSKKQSTLSLTYPDSSTDQKTLTVDYVAQEKGSKNYEFCFDRVFGPDRNQQNVFSEISQLVQSALDGYNVCIFAYGQTGSGKTFTMEGPEEGVLMASGGDGRGMIPRAVEQVFESAISLREKGWEYKMEATFLEIYNESLRDLLSSSSGNKPHDIKKDPNHAGEVYVTNVTPTVVTSQQQVQKLLERASKNRAVAATQCNERSSRSHSVFIFHISGKNELTGENCRGVLNLVDLAGSERLSQSGSAGERLKETKSINKSLTNLGTVIMALANKEAHIPYRNSKLTYLLQNSLGGNSKTLMFVNVSPQAESFQETLCSLRFATTVNQCNIGTARKASK